MKSTAIIVDGTAFTYQDEIEGIAPVGGIKPVCT